MIGEECPARAYDDRDRRLLERGVPTAPWCCEKAAGHQDEHGLRSTLSVRGRLVWFIPDE